MERQRRAIVIHSPHSGRSAYLSQAITDLKRVGVSIAQVVAIDELDTLPAQGDYWKERGVDIAIAAGGDGLIGGVITHIARSRLPLGILPLGTANDIARSLNIPLNLFQATEVIAMGKEIEVDIGVAQPAQQAPHPANSNAEAEGLIRSKVASQKHGFFAHALTVGLNVQFARLATNIATRRHYGRMTYPIAALEVLRGLQVIEVDLRFDGVVLPQTDIFTRQQHIAVPGVEMKQASLHCNAFQVAVINAPIFGGQWHLAVPGATMSDRLLDIVVIENIESGDLATAIAQFFSLQAQHLTSQSNWEKSHAGHLPAELSGIPGIHHLQASGVMITTNADPCDVTLDGEIRGQTPTYVCMANERLRVMLPGDMPKM